MNKLMQPVCRVLTFFSLLCANLINNTIILKNIRNYIFALVEEGGGSQYRAQMFSGLGSK